MSLRVSQDIRIIVHKDGDSLLLWYVDHHDKAYAWAERRKLEVHPTTGAAQLVEVRETVREVPVIIYVAGETWAGPDKALTIGDRGNSQDDVLSYGVPEEWLDDVLAATDETVLDVADHLPQEAAEAVLELALGNTLAIAEVAAPTADSFAHPDAQRRFRVMQNVEELERALDFPWDKWSVFLHPAQRGVVERRFAGPARVAGGRRYGQDSGRPAEPEICLFPDEAAEEQGIGEWLRLGLLMAFSRRPWPSSSAHRARSSGLASGSQRWTGGD